LLYVAVNGGNSDEGEYSLLVINVSDPTSPQQINDFSFDNFIYEVVVDGDNAYVAVDGNTGMQVVDISDLADLSQVAAGDLYSSTIAVSGNYAYVDDYPGMTAVAISDPADPQQVNSLDVPGSTKSITIGGGQAYVASGPVGFSLVESTGNGDIIPPDAPASLTATVENGQVVLSWSASSGSDVRDYRIYRGATPKPTKQIATVATGTESFTDTEVSSNGAAYHYRITAVDDAGNESSFSEEVNTAGPAPPAGLTASGSDKQVTLAWVVNAENDVTGYNVYRGTASFSNPAAVTKVNGSALVTDSTYTDSTVSNRTTYHYRIAAVDDAGNESNLSEEVSVTPQDRIAPAVPTELTASAEDENIRLTWTASSSADVTEAFLYRTALGSTRTLLDTLASNATSYTDATAELRVRYYYQLKVRDEAGNESSFSESATTFLAPAEVTYDVAKDFGDASESADYRLVALPGRETRPLSDVLTGKAGAGWRAFRQSESGDSLTAYREVSGGFSFGPGKGFWVIAKEGLSTSATAPSVEIADDGTYNLDLHAGWNIISNPTGKSLSWSAVQAASNNASQPLWSFEDGSYERTDTLASTVAEGRAYYFFNQNDRGELVFPYAPDTSDRDAAQAQLATRQETDTDASNWSLGLTASRTAPSPKSSTRRSRAYHATVRVGVAEAAALGFDRRDQPAPPGRFEPVSLGLLSKTDSLELATEYRPSASDENGQRFRLMLRSKPGHEVTIQTQEEDQLPSGRHALLLREATGERFSLSEAARFTPDEKKEQLRLLVGTDNFVEEAAEEVAPSESKLVGSYPNPFRQRATIAYDIASESEVRLMVYDVLGREVRTLVDERQSAGRRKATLQARSLSSGVYVFRLRIGDHVETGRLVLVR